MAQAVGRLVRIDGHVQHVARMRRPMAGGLRRRLLGVGERGGSGRSRFLCACVCGESAACARVVRTIIRLANGVGLHYDQIAFRTQIALAAHALLLRQQCARCVWMTV